VRLNKVQRAKIEAVCREHAAIRGWVLHAVSARSNHVHLAVTADKSPAAVRDQFKANATRVLRREPEPIGNSKVWTRGGDCEIVDGENELDSVVTYITMAQDRMDRGK
jgi:REP element-mobilizing transposase RayT